MINMIYMISGHHCLNCDFSMISMISVISGHRRIIDNIDGAIDLQNHNNPRNHTVIYMIYMINMITGHRRIIDGASDLQNHINPKNHKNHSSDSSDNQPSGATLFNTASTVAETIISLPFKDITVSEAYRSIINYVKFPESSEQKSAKSIPLRPRSYSGMKFCS
jgi:hypothetical protein